MLSLLRLTSNSSSSYRQLCLNCFSYSGNLGISLYSRGTDHTDNTVLPLCGADNTENTSRDHYLIGALDCCLATSYNIRPQRHSFHCCALEPVYLTVARQCFDQICCNTKNCLLVHIYWNPRKKKSMCACVYVLVWVSGWLGLKSCQLLRLFAPG
jgi:hypothetical protein